MHTQEVPDFTLLFVVRSQDVQLFDEIEQVLQVGSQETHEVVEESHIVVLLHVHKPVTEFIIWVAYGQVVQAEPELHVAHDESQSTHTLLTLL